MGSSQVKEFQKAVGYKGSQAKNEEPPLPLGTGPNFLKIAGSFQKVLIIGEKVSYCTKLAGDINVVNPQSTVELLPAIEVSHKIALEEKTSAEAKTDESFQAFIRSFSTIILLHVQGVKPTQFWEDSQESLLNKNRRLIQERLSTNTLLFVLFPESRQAKLTFFDSDWVSSWKSSIPASPQFECFNNFRTWLPLTVPVPCQKCKLHYSATSLVCSWCGVVSGPFCNKCTQEVCSEAPTPLAKNVEVYVCHH